MIYINNKNKITVSISTNVLNKAIQMCDESADFETGGIILGYYSLDLSEVVITELVGPPLDSKFGRTWFIRGIQGLKRRIIDKWKINEYYLGEWHFHPTGSSLPSCVDNKQLIMISRSEKFKCPEPIMLILSRSQGGYDASLTMCFKGKMLWFIPKPD